MKLKYITKPTLISFLRWMDKNRHLHGPYRVRYSSFRSKRDMLADFSKMYAFSEDNTNYSFTLRKKFAFLSAPTKISFDKNKFEFHVAGNTINLEATPPPPSFHVRHEPIIIIF